MSEPEIRKEANNQVSIALAGIKDPKAAASIIGSTGQLFMLDYTGTLEPIVSKSASGQASYRPTLYALLNAAKNRPNTHYYEGSHARAVVRVRREDAQARCSTRSASRSRRAPPRSSC